MKNTIIDHLTAEHLSSEMHIDALNIPRIVYKNRILKGWSIEKALSTPVNRSHNSTTINHQGNTGIIFRCPPVCKRYNVDPKLLKRKCHSKCTSETALLSRIG